MIYSRNKDSFKKSTHKVHTQAQSNLLSLVKVMTKSDDKNKQSENTSNNNMPKSYSSSPPKITIAKRLQPSPKLCESQYEISKNLNFYHLYNCQIKGSPLSKFAAHKQYTQLLEVKIKELEQKMEKSKSDLEHSQSDIKEEVKLRQKLQKYYHSSRTYLVLLSTQLIECKSIVAQTKNQERIQCINSLLSETEELLEVNRSAIQKGEKTKIQNCSKDIHQLRLECQYQRKTIDFLRKQNQNGPQFNQIRLLRHQINRLSTQNQKLILKLSEKGKQKQVKPQQIKRTQNREQSLDNNKSDKNQQKDSLIELQIKQINQKLHERSINLNQVKQQLSKKNIEVNKLNESIRNLNQQLTEKGNYLIKYKEEKECLLELLEESRTKNQRMEKLMNQNKVKQAQNKLPQQITFDIHKEIATTEEFIKALKPYPKFQKLFMNIVSMYEEKVSVLQEKVVEEKCLKDKFMGWSGSVYKLLENANIEPQVVEAHMEELYSMDRIMDNSNLDKFLRQIRSLSVGVDESEVRQMENELQEYIISLKQRNQVIKQVELEDGSSVVVSQNFTDRQFDFDQFE